MDKKELNKIANKCRDVLLNDIVDFWNKYSLDKQEGGCISYLARDGSVLSYDKSVWVQGRTTWMYSKLYNDFSNNEKWLEAAENVYNFLKSYCYDSDGRMFFRVTRDGKPLIKRERHYISETMAAIGCAEYSKAARNTDALDLARKTFKSAVNLYKHPELLPPKMNPNVRPMAILSYPIVMLQCAQGLRDVDEECSYEETIDIFIKDILNKFVKSDKKALLENVGAGGEFLNNPEGRLVNPGHSIEVAYFIVLEGRRRGDRELVKKGLNIIDWSLELGWDKKYGGIFYFVDIEGYPAAPLESDMKLWWPHDEALYASLLSYIITGDKKYKDWFYRIDEWVDEHFTDREYGERFGYLHRDGSISQTIKGNYFKGFFHTPRYLLYSIKLIEEVLAKN